MLHWPKMRCIAGALLIAPIAASAGVAVPDFESDILPILQRSCYACHGPEKQKSGYRLDVRDTALRGGDSGQVAMAPHDSLASALIQRVTHASGLEPMPPPDSDTPPLSDIEIALLKAWIDGGPIWPDAFAGTPEDKAPHWSSLPLVQPAVPARAAHPIDAFILEKLDAAGIAPSPPADRRTLMRRVSLDLTGLPPTPEALDAFVADPDPLAYDKLVDSLLTSPRHGERWARHWLDTVHFADSHGYEHDLARDHAWRYRDYVIASLNNDTPWPRFIREQLAADYFFPEETGLTAALGFLGAGNFDLSTYATSTVTFDYLDRDDLVTQCTAAFLGSTANCARCHDHKFDPIPQEDYYALQAVFAGVLKGDVAYDADPAVARARREWTALLSAVESGDASALLTPENNDRVRAWQGRYGRGAQWNTLDVETFLAAEGSELSLGADGVIVASGARPEKEVYTVTASTALNTITAIRLEVLAQEGLPMGGPGRADNGNLHLSEFEVRLFTPGTAQAMPLPIRRASADFNQIDWAIDRAIDGDAATAWGIHPAEGTDHVAVFELAEPVQLTPESRIAVTLKQSHGGGHLIGAIRLSATADDAESAIPFSAAVLDALDVPEPDRTQAQHTAIASAILGHTARHALDQLPAQAVVYAAAPAVEIPDGEVAVMRRSLDAPKPVHLMVRGDLEKPGALVNPGALTALTHLPARFDQAAAGPEAARRAALADWIAHPDNVLTWRCIVNRVWHYHFGEGICNTPSDLGRMGGVPSHPELLDWLAVWFRDEAKGSLRALHRLIVTSDAYRQSSGDRADAASADSDNRLLWRQHAARLDADAYRDSVLAVSGRLDLTMGGPGDRHFTEAKGPQITPALDYGAYDWRNARQTRRSIYRFVWRGIADPFLEALDFPDLGLLSPKRTASVSSLQALALYNNEFVLAHGEALAQRVAAETASIDAQVTRAVQLAWLRTPTVEEAAAYTAFAREHGMPAFCRVLFNSNEFLFLD
ncbi:MAG: PSD1 domain-containing protein [Candidatus Hydrogenedentes bacterium]|nr:PSD1 domain-containing protein [Candidatus Hydrogenedentota bacterium]